MALFKTALRAALGPSSPHAQRILKAAHQLRRSWTDPLLEPPVPLLAPDQSLLIIWSAKSACSLTFVWYLRLVGLLDHYRASGMSPHEYRGRHYVTSDAFRRGKQRVLDDYRVVHVIRDPYLRAVSCYRHVLAHGFADKRFRVFDGGRLNRRDGFSFNAYLDFLETLDLAHTNLHHRQQLHRIERIRAPDHVINISKGRMLQELNRLEIDCAIEPTDFSKLDWAFDREERRRARTTAFGAEGIPDVPLTPLAALGMEPWPNYEQFLTARTRRRVETLYAADFQAFNDYL